MPTPKHLGIVDLLGRDLAIIPELLARAEGREPSTDLRYEKRDGRLIAYGFRGPPREIQVDVLLVAFPADVPGGSPQIAVPFECQLWKDPEKLFRYVEYLAAARRDNRCRGQAGVFSPDDHVLAYIRRLFEAEPHLCPVLVGKDAVPMVLTLEQAIARQELVTLCAIVHAGSAEGRALARQVLLSARHVEATRGQANVRILLNCLEENEVNELQKTPEYRETTEGWPRPEPGPWLRSRAGFSLGLEEGRVEGRVEGRAEGLQRGLELTKQALKLVLVARGLIASTEQLERVDACTSPEVLERWISRAAHANSVAELLAS